ncbi:hypothetical protein B0H10DRAFT_1882561 [Mycena sp. CBHHK59/15]|nr:hypothetical protein B0H10DRAFT_1882561 [Mycena sp. CBHHK59/15]
MATEIILYDIPSTLPGKAWSPSTWKTRYSLNYKGIPYKTVWTEYPDIELVSRVLGAPPSRKKPDGRPHYTLPMIHDPSTGVFISDSTKIAEYLDKTFPETPRLMPPGTVGFHRAFVDEATASLGPLFLYGLPASHAYLNPASQTYFRRTREESFGKTLEAMVPTGEDHIVAWQRLKDGLGKMDGWIRANGDDSRYIMGDTLCFADIWMASFVIWIRLVMPERWEEVKIWHGSRWGKLLESLEAFESVH